MAQLRVVAYDAQRFSVSNEHKSLVAEHSDFGHDKPLFNQLYDDACDVGIELYNAATGVTTRWYVLDQEKDDEGDLIVTLYAPCPETLRKHQNLRGWTVHILND